MQCVRGGSGGMPCDLRAKHSTVCSSIKRQTLRSSDVNLNSDGRAKKYSSLCAHYEGMTFLVSALHGGEWPASCHGHFAPKE
jgi:hypothetical protein